MLNPHSNSWQGHWSNIVAFFFCCFPFCSFSRLHGASHLLFSRKKGITWQYFLSICWRSFQIGTARIRLVTWRRVHPAEYYAGSKFCHMLLFGFSCRIEARQRTECDVYIPISSFSSRCPSGTPRQKVLFVLQGIRRRQRKYFRFWCLEFRRYRSKRMHRPASLWIQ